MSSTTSTSIKHICWLALRDKPQTIRDAAIATGLYYEAASTAIRGMAECGQVRALNKAKRNQPVVYVATDKEPQISPRHAYVKGNKPKRPERPLPTVKCGNGSGLIELERLWAWPDGLQ